MNPSVTSVHVTLDNFQALSEFWNDTDGDPDTHATCGPDAWLMTIHALRGEPLNQDELDQIRDEMRARNWFGVGGCNIEELKAYTQLKGYAVAAFIPWGAGQQAAIHQALKDNCVAKNGVILQLDAAHDLTGNEPGVNSHFIAIGGIDSQAGYLVGNGDDVNALAVNNGHGKIIPTRWMTWDTLLAAQPVALLAIKGNDPNMPYTTNADGTLQYNAGKLGLGFSNYVRAHGIKDDLLFPDYYYNQTECCCEFYSGTVLYYSAQTGQVQDGKAAYVIQHMRDALRAHGVN